MLNQKDIIALESLNFFNELQEQERKAMLENNPIYKNQEQYEKFKEDMLQYGDFSEEELQEMWESEMLVEYDL